jgi:hypothetical protein
MRSFSKSKLLALRQCQKRLWLEIHQPDLREDSSATEMSFRIGHQVGNIAQQIYDPEGIGAVIDFKTEGFRSAFDRTLRLMKSAQPLFEAGFSAGGALAFADVMLPQQVDGKSTWRMVEVKEMAIRFPGLSNALLAINERVVDLLPIARERYYHPSQQGSWSIKKVLPAVTSVSL